jgi:hypothetical protein
MLGDRGGEKGVLRGSHRPLAVASCRHRAVYEQKNSGPAAASAEIAGSSCRGPEQHPYSTAYSRAQGIPQPAAGLSRCAGRAQAQPSRADAARWISQRFAGRVLLTDPSSLLRVPKPLLPEQPGPVRRELRRGSGKSNTRPSDRITGPARSTVISAQQRHEMASRTAASHEGYRQINGGYRADRSAPARDRGRDGRQPLWYGAACWPRTYHRARVSSQ